MMHPPFLALSSDVVFTCLEGRSRTGDATMLHELLSQIPATGVLATVTTDVAYDPRLCHAAIAERGAVAIIPPKTADSST